jgi:PHD/YefM family antitoxin component YafN of YafNO toxin-antitoxin module/mRNA-degrading endonuclease YafQ of YafQ-DinJ toxin-antitoxin module
MNTVAAQEIKRRGISAVDRALEEGAVHVIKNNVPQYVVLSEDRYRELLEAEDLARIARVRESLEALARGDARRFENASELLAAIGPGPRRRPSFRERVRASGCNRRDGRRPVVHTLVTPEPFLRPARKFFRKHPDLKPVFAERMEALRRDPFDPSLRLHPLRGKLEGLFAIRLTHSYRVTLTLALRAGEIVLLDIGSHDDVCR